MPIDFTNCEKNKFKVFGGANGSKLELKQFFWEMFVIDAFIGNFDRHNGNWRFLLN